MTKVISIGKPPGEMETPGDFFRPKKKSTNVRCRIAADIQSVIVNKPLLEMKKGKPT